MSKNTRINSPLALYSTLVIGGALCVTVVTSIVYLPFTLLNTDTKAIFQEILWLQGVPIVLGFSGLLLDLLINYQNRRNNLQNFSRPGSQEMVTVVLTALDDASAVGQAVEDFAAHPRVKRVLLIDNASTDETPSNAARAGATVISEPVRGYGSCVYRALSEGSKFTDTDFVILCEADGTFRSADIDKFLAYSKHAHVVLGTRIVELLRGHKTQLTTFIFWGNFLAAKLLELKHLGRATLSDLGTTYKLCRSDFLRDNLSQFDKNINLEFNAHFMDLCLRDGFRLVEIPITFFPRVGRSKGGNSSNLKAIKVGLRMLLGIGVSWTLVRGKK
jgi:glycosyltransferase involved in cell wall biosynthesis